MPQPQPCSSKTETPLTKPGPQPLPPTTPKDQNDHKRRPKPKSRVRRERSRSKSPRHTENKHRQATPPRPKEQPRAKKDDESQRKNKKQKLPEKHNESSNHPDNSVKTTRPTTSKSPQRPTNNSNHSENSVKTSRPTTSKCPPRPTNNSNHPDTSSTTSNPNARNTPPRPTNNPPASTTTRPVDLRTVQRPREKLLRIPDRMKMHVYQELETEYKRINIAKKRFPESYDVPDPSTRPLKQPRFRESTGYLSNQLCFQCGDQYQEDMNHQCLPTIPNRENITPPAPVPFPTPIPARGHDTATSRSQNQTHHPAPPPPTITPNSEPAPNPTPFFYHQNNIGSDPQPHYFEQPPADRPTTSSHTAHVHTDADDDYFTYEYAPPNDAAPEYHQPSYEPSQHHNPPQTFPQTPNQQRRAQPPRPISPTPSVQIISEHNHNPPQTFPQTPNQQRRAQPPRPISPTPSVQIISENIHSEDELELYNAEQFEESDSTSSRFPSPPPQRYTPEAPTYNQPQPTPIQPLNTQHTQPHNFIDPYYPCQTGIQNLQLNIQHRDNNQPQPPPNDLRSKLQRKNTPSTSNTDLIQPPTFHHPRKQFHPRHIIIAPKSPEHTPKTSTHRTRSNAITAATYPRVSNDDLPGTSGTAPRTAKVKPNNATLKYTRRHNN